VAAGELLVLRESRGTSAVAGTGGRGLSRKVIVGPKHVDSRKLKPTSAMVRVFAAFFPISIGGVGCFSASWAVSKTFSASLCSTFPEARRPGRLER